MRTRPADQRPVAAMVPAHLLTQPLDNEVDRRSAMRRTLDHYLRTAYAAAPLLGFLIHTPVLPPPAHGVTVESLADRDSAWARFVAEREVLLAAIGQASAGGIDVHTWQLGRQREMTWC